MTKTQPYEIDINAKNNNYHILQSKWNYLEIVAALSLSCSSSASQWGESKQGHPVSHSQTDRAEGVNGELKHTPNGGGPKLSPPLSLSLPPPHSLSLSPSLIY